MSQQQQQPRLWALAIRPPEGRQRRAVNPRNGSVDPVKGFIVRLSSSFDRVWWLKCTFWHTNNWMAVTIVCSYRENSQTDKKKRIHFSVNVFQNLKLETIPLAVVLPPSEVWVWWEMFPCHTPPYEQTPIHQVSYRGWGDQSTCWAPYIPPYCQWWFSILLPQALPKTGHSSVATTRDP